MKNVLRNVFLYTLALFVASLFSVSKAEAAQVQNLQVDLSSSRPLISATHTFTFTHITAATLRQVSFRYCDAPSGTCIGPTSLDASNADKASLSGLTNAEWTIDGPAANHAVVQHVATGQAVGGSTVIVAGVSGVTNGQISDDCDGSADTSSDTCYVQLTSYSDLGTTPVDVGVTSYTIVQPVTVSARVDPTFTFVVSAVNANTVSNAITSSVATTYGSIPFGNLTAGTPKYAAQRLQVITNTVGGYTVEQSMTTAMTGVYASNNIDPFIALWGTPTTWTEPTGTSPSVNTGWIGANTNDADITAFIGSGLFGPVSSTGNTVMSSTTSDNGSTTVIVMYGIEANVFQPADTYTGSLMYNALPVY